MEIRKTEKIDVTKYVGTKCKIEKAQYMDSKYGEVIFLQTNKIDLKDGDTLPDGSELTGTIFLSLFKNEDGLVFVGEDTKAEKFLKSKKVDISKLPDFEVGEIIKDLQEIDVVVQKNQKGFLEIA